MTAADVLAAIGRGLAFGVVWLLIGLLIALALGAIISRADRDAEAIDRRDQATAEANEIALSMQFGGASDFQHDNGGAR